MNDSHATVPATAVDIMLVSHTNAGKTTLVRTLLGKDVGEVIDAPDVTQAVAAYDLAVDDGVGSLRLWDTPGFGDSFRLARRLRQRYRWIAWIVRELWDRHRNPRLWRSQRVALDLRARADVILYLVNVLERPGDAVYVAPELEVLAWIGKPVLAILNQGGDTAAGDAEDPGIGEWREALAGHPVVVKTLGLDAYTRCWLQELVLYDEIGRVLPAGSHDAYRKLAAVVQAGHRQRFHASIDAIAEYLVRLARDRVELGTDWLAPLKELWELVRKKVSFDDAEEMQPHERAMQSLARHFIDETKAMTDRLIEINRLHGVSAGEIVETAGEKFSIDGPVGESTTALAGGVITGAIAGLGADLLAGGLSLGAGALAGGILGAVGAAALARGYNIYSNKGNKVIAWSPASLTEAFGKAVAMYLAIAHFGGGQGEWRRREDPQYRVRAVAAAIERQGERLQQLWTHAATAADAQEARRECAEVLQRVLVEVLQRLYPEASGYLDEPPPEA